MQETNSFKVTHDEKKQRT